MILPLSEKTEIAVLQALKDDYFEGAVEVVFAAHPEATRDDAVDTVNAIEQEKAWLM